MCISLNILLTEINILILHKWSLCLCSYIELWGASHIFTLAPAQGFSRPSAGQLSGSLTLCVFEYACQNLRHVT